MSPNSLVAAASFSARSLEPPDAWMGHLPFGAWAVRQVAPRILVELGTHSGNSYFSFCQSIDEAGLATKAFAVDTWQGDEHAGHYDESVWTRVNAHNQECYAGFSRLLRMTFDDAVSYFSEGSIDLLHIDGLHTHEAVRHDFETWLPKLAPGAVVMFHDTNVRERGFGVWKFWEELRSRYPSHLEFVHSHGLGVLQLDNATRNNRQKWLQLGEVDPQELKNYFAALGSKQVEHFALSGYDDLKKRLAELDVVQEDAKNLTLTLTSRDARIAELMQHAENLGLVVAERDARIAELGQHAENLGLVVAERDARIAELRQFASELSLELGARDESIARVSRESAERGRQIADLKQAQGERDARIADLRQGQGERDARIADLGRQVEECAATASSEIATLGEKVRYLETELWGRTMTISDLRASTSWRLTYPLRALKRLFARLLP